MKKIALLLIVALAAVAVKAQVSKHYLSVGGLLGQSGYRYDIQGGKVKPQFGMGAKLGYTYFFHNQWGIHTGLVLARYSTKATVGLYKQSFENQVDSEGGIFRRDVFLEDWNEKQRTLLLAVPVSIRFKQTLSTSLRLYADAGFEFQLPLNSSYEITNGTVESKAYYPKWNVYLENLPEHGLSKENRHFPDGNVKQKINLAALLGVGLEYELSSRYSLYLGATSSIGLTKAKSSSEDNLLSVSSMGFIDYSGISTSNIGGKMRSFSLMAELGVNIRLGK